MAVLSRLFLWAAALALTGFGRTIGPESTMCGQVPAGITSGSLHLVPPANVPPPPRSSARIRVDLGPDGAVIGMAIARSTGSLAYDRAALSAAQGAVFTPQMVNCRPVSGTYLVVIEFGPAVLPELPDVRYEGPARDARLGVAAAAVAALIDAGVPLEHSAGETFARDFIAALIAGVQREDGKEAARALRAFLDFAPGTDPVRLRDEFEFRVGRIMQRENAPAGERFLIGELGAEIHRNAAGAHNRQRDYSWRIRLTGMEALDALDPEIGRARRALIAAQAGDWAAVAAQSAALVAAILRA